MFYTSAHTPDGEFHLIFNNYGIVLASGFGSIRELAARLPKGQQREDLIEKTVHPYQQLILAYYGGDQDALEKIPHYQGGSDFQQSVWQAISSIAYGRTMSYKDLAAAADNPAAIRAAGTACGQNRLCLLVPCHRVLTSDGRVGNYLYGSAIKSALLVREGTSKDQPSRGK